MTKAKREHTSEAKPAQTPEDKKIKEVVDKHMGNLDEVVLSTLAQCLSSGLMYYDVSYIPRRIIQAMEEAFPIMDFKNAKLEGELKTYLNDKSKELIEKVKIAIYDSDSREAKCEPIVHSVIKTIASPDFMGKDKEWLDSYLEETNRLFAIKLWQHLFETLFNRTDFSLEQSMVQAQKILFGVEKAQLPLKRLDEILKIK